jgi:hypothetical protein
VAARVLLGRYERRLLRDAVSVEDHRGQRWALLRPSGGTGQQVERLLAEVREGLQVMPVLSLREEGRPLME